MLGTLFSPVRLLIDVYPGIGTLWQTLATNYGPLKLFLLLEVLVNVGLVLGWICAAVLLFLRRPSYPTTFITLVALALAFSVLDVLIAKIGFGAQLTWSDFRPVVSNAVTCAVWIPYMLLSVRVRNTFARESPVSTAPQQPSG
jgi:hypothetical protein